jgi:hypothetical protein
MAIHLAIAHLLSFLARTLALPMDAVVLIVNRDKFMDGRRNDQQSLTRFVSTQHLVSSLIATRLQPYTDDVAPPSHFPPMNSHSPPMPIVVGCYCAVLVNMELWQEQRGAVFSYDRALAFCIHQIASASTE